ncbi:CRPV-177 [Crowpox virus]|nr:CRPV-177 [Crowpox virus]
MLARFHRESYEGSNKLFTEGERSLTVNKLYTYYYDISIN